MTPEEAEAFIHSLNDKANWPPGPWRAEPDRMEWVHSGRPCLAIRSATTGAWCGYVAVPPGHPWHGEGDVETDVHGGITYAGECSGAICHTPKDGASDDVWWLGFDCGHCFDLMPKMVALVEREFQPWRDGTYRDATYIRTEVERLAIQATAASS